MLPANAKIDEQLLARTCRQAPRGDLYVFGYGSLMWRPGFPHTAAMPARLFGHSRRCAVRSTHYRGTPRRPGLVFGLDAGGSCNGMLYRVAAADKNRVIRYLFKREMFSDAYTPRYLDVRTAAGRRHRALTFVVRRDTPQYAPPMPDAAAAAIIRAAAGSGGKNSDYFHNTLHHLRQIGVSSPRLARLCRMIESAADGG